MSEQEVVTCKTTKNHSEKNNSLSRRDFLKLSATVGTVAAISDFTLGGPIKTLVEGAKPQATMPQEDVWIPTVCFLCDENCGLHAHRINGVVVKVEGNPAHPLNQGRICARPNAALDTLYNPWRVKTPVKRTNPQKGRGVDPQWVEITWDEALNTITDKLKPIMKNDPRRLVTFTGHRDHTSVMNQFSAAFGTPNTGFSGGGGMFCKGYCLHIMANLYMGSTSYVPVFTPAMDLAQYNVSHGGAQWIENKATPEIVRQMVEGKDRGEKFVAIDPMMSSSLDKADVWIPIRPSSDLALMLAICDVIVNELNTYDVAYMKVHTNAPYLIGPDGHYVRSKTDLVTDPFRLKQKVGKPYLWDIVDKKAKTWDDPTLKDTALEGSYVVDGVQCKPAFQLFKDQVKSNTPEWAEKLTTVPAQTIRNLAKEWVDNAQIGSTITVDGNVMPFRPVLWAGGRGVHNTIWGFDSYAAQWIMQMLVGAMGVPGGVTGGPDFLQLNPADGVNWTTAATYGAYNFGPVPPVRADQQELFPMSYKVYPRIWKAILNPKDYYLQYPIEAALFSGVSAIQGCTEPNTIAQAMMKIPFIFTMSYQFGEEEQLADIVLPDNSFMERYTIASATAITPEQVTPGSYSTTYTVLRQPTLDTPVYNSRDTNDIMIDLAERLGILYGNGGLNDRANRSMKAPYKLDLNKKYAFRDIVDLTLKSSFGDQYGLDWFKTNWLKPASSLKATEYFGSWSPTQKIRRPFYNEYFLWAGEQWASDLKKNGLSVQPNNDFHTTSLHPFPTFIPSPQISGDTAVPSEYDLWAIHSKTLVHSMANPMSEAWKGELLQLHDPYTMMILMNTETAQAKGIKTGDSVVVESPWGKTSGQVKVTELIHPEAVGIFGCFGNTSVDMPAYARFGPHMNELCTLDERYINGITYGFENRARVKVYKA